MAKRILTEDLEKQVMELYKVGMTYEKIGETLNVSKSMVGVIVKKANGIASDSTIKEKAYWPLWKEWRIMNQKYGRGTV